MELPATGLGELVDNEDYYSLLNASREVSCFIVLAAVAFISLLVSIWLFGVGQLADVTDSEQAFTYSTLHNELCY